MEKMHRIQKVSAFMGGLCLVLAILAPLAVALVWIQFTTFAPNLPGINQLPFDPADTGALTRLAGFLVHMLPTAIAIYGLLQARRLFGLYRIGRIFTLDNTRCLTRIARALIAYTLVLPVCGSLLSVLLTWHNPPGERMLTVTFSSDYIGLLVIGASMLVITWIMDEGRKLAEDNAQIV
jgi:hypothetical protein